MKYVRGSLPSLISAALLVAGAAWSAPAAQVAAMRGFSATDAANEQALEERFDAQLNPEDLRNWMMRMASEANHVGSPHDKENAEFLRDQFRNWGWNADIETFDVLYPTLKEHTLEMIEPKKFVASLKEPSIRGDATTARSDGLPPYNVYGADGDVTGTLVYVNYGMPDDYKDLMRRGVDVKGRIAIVRYGGGWRGLKPKLAYEHGAVGCIIYSDPRDDGYSAGDPYPMGGWRTADSVQRGSVGDMPVYSGDPLTPGVGATKNARRLSVSDAPSVLKIPVMPISYADAQPLLAALQGPVAPPAWRGGLPITYHLGPGPAKVHMKIVSDWSLKTLYDVIAKIPGAEMPDEWVIRGNHHDGWVYGAWDPLSGQVAEMAEAKAIGALLGTGWRPKRTLIYASWDGEEPGLLGSTEWAETHAQELQQKAVLYLNSDSIARGFFSAGGSHSLEKFVNEVSASVKDAETNVTAQARLRARLLVAGYESGASEAEKKIAPKVAAGGDLPINPLGTGSDYTPFLQHLGITSLDLRYNGEEDQAGVYHSKYDTFEHYVRFGDPGFVYGVAEAQTVGRAVLRMANADVLPLEFGSVAETFAGYLDELHKLADDKREKSMQLAKLLDEDAFKLAADPTRRVLPPDREPEVPYLDFAPLDNVMVRLQKSAKAYDDAYAKLANGSKTLSVADRTELNAQLRGMEQALTDARGLPGRDWYKHLIYAPGLLTGYGVKTMPGVREAIEDNRWEEANQYIGITAAALGAYCDRLDKATTLLN